MLPKYRKNPCIYTVISRRVDIQLCQHEQTLEKREIERKRDAL